VPCTKHQQPRRKSNLPHTSLSHHQKPDYPYFQPSPHCCHAARYERLAAGQPAALKLIATIDGSELVNTVSGNRVVADRLWPAAACVRTTRRGAPLVLATIMFALVGCSESTAPATTTMVAASTATTEAGTGPVRAAMMDEPTRAATATTPAGAQPRLASDPAQLADDLVADEQALRDASTAEAALVAAARRQQAAYRAIGRHPEWDAITRPRIPPQLLEVYDRNVTARRQLTAMTHVKNTLPAWRIESPAPADELLGYYREAESASGVGWNYLAAINLIETRFGSIDGVSTAGAEGPMQFLPATFATYGEGGDIRSPHDSIMAAGRYLAANGFANDRDQAIYRYNRANEYVQAVNQYAALLAADPAAYAGYYRWDVYYNTTAGDVLLPIGYAATSPIPVGDYLATHPQ
jgi:Transglycosylase SLT domain